MGEAVFGAFFTVTIIALSFAGSTVILKQLEASYECKTNPDCGSFSYCGADHQCHTFPNVSQTVVNPPDWTRPAAIVGLSIVLAALVLRRRM